MITIVISDIHGYSDELNKILNYCEDNFKDKGKIRYIFLGDYIDRGPNSKEVVNIVREYQKNKKAICLLGNHEDMAINAMNEYKNSSSTNVHMEIFTRNGGNTTLNSYENNLQKFNEDVKWFKTLHYFYEDDNRFYVHAGIMPGIELKKQSKNTMLWVREHFLWFDGKHEKYIVHGHTPAQFTNNKTKIPLVYENRANCDTGICFGYFLSALIFNNDTEKPAGFISCNIGGSPAYSGF